MSLNYYSPGAVINFLHRKIVEIEAAEPGYKRISIHSQPGGELTRAKATYRSAKEFESVIIALCEDFLSELGENLVWRTADERR